MNSFFNELFVQVQNDLGQIHTHSQDNLLQVEEAYKLLYAAYQKLKRFVSTYTFASDEEEIHYFKFLKPQISSRLIYYLRVYHLETKKPQGSNHAKKNYFLTELDHIQTYFYENIEFVHYCRTDENYLDHLYFLRNKLDFKKMPDTFSIELDQTQGTDHGYKLASIQANELLQNYIDDQIGLLESGSVVPSAARESDITKIESGFSVASLALFFRLQMDIGIIKQKSTRDVVDHISENYQTAKSSKISSESIRTKFYTYDDVTIEVVKSRIIAMLNRIKEI